MIVVVAGGYRTGSTVAYMTVQRLLEAAGMEYDYFGVNADTVYRLRRKAAKRRRRVRILKCHDAYLDPLAGQRIFWCRRNPYDMVGSRLRMGGSDETALANLAASLELERRYRGRSDVCMLDYDALYGDPMARVEAIASFLDLHVSRAARKRICRETAVGVVKATTDALENADPHTELRPRHVGAALGRPGSYDLPAELRARIDAMRAAA